MSKLAGKVAVVTGASKGIGAGRQGARRGRRRRGRQLRFEQGGRGRGGGGDHQGRRQGAGGPGRRVQGGRGQGRRGRRAQRIRAARHLVNNSGVYEFAAIETSTEEQYRKMFDINVLGTLLTTKAAVPASRRGRQRDQHLVGGDQPADTGIRRSTPDRRARSTPSPECWRTSLGRARSASTRSTRPRSRSR